jgi:hypothetical protein
MFIWCHAQLAWVACLEPMINRGDIGQLPVGFTILVQFLTMPAQGWPDLTVAHKSAKAYDGMSGWRKIFCDALISSFKGTPLISMK